MPTNKEKSVTLLLRESSTTYKDKRKDYTINTYFDNSESILEITKRLIKNEIANSYLNNPIKSDWRSY